MAVVQICGPWTEAELVELERIKDVLRAKGLADEEQGLTNHGDPWLALCDADGCVLLHVARIGTIYYYDGLGISKPRVVARLDDVVGVIRSLRMTG